jgi:hypothetical protein
MQAGQALAPFSCPNDGDLCNSGNQRHTHDTEEAKQAIRYLLHLRCPFINFCHTERCAQHPDPAAPCDRCQMFAELADIIPGAEDWPRFTTNQSERFEARLSMVEVQDSPSLFFTGMAGVRLPIAVAHGEGYANFKYRGNADKVIAAMRFTDHHGIATETYPFNPNGSPRGLTAVTTPDGRFTAMMPHPERVFRSIQMSWTNQDASGFSPWMQLWRNARRWVNNYSMSMQPCGQ